MRFIGGDAYRIRRRSRRGRRKRSRRRRRGCRRGPSHVIENGGKVATRFDSNFQRIFSLLSGKEMRKKNVNVNVI